MMRRFICFVLLFIMLLPSLVYAEPTTTTITSISAADSVTKVKTASEIFTTLGQLWDSSSNKVMRGNVALMVTHYQTLMEYAYIVSLSTEDLTSPELDKALKAVQLATDTIKSKITSEFPALDSFETTAHERPLITSLTPLALDEKPMESIADIRNSLRQANFLTVPIMWGALCDYLEAIEGWEEPTNRQAISLAQNGFENTLSFNTRYGNEENGDVLASEDEVTGTQASNYYDMYGARFQAHSEVKAIEVNENLAVSGGDISGLVLLHERVSFVKRFPEETLEAILTGGLSIDNLTGPDVWEPLEGVGNPFKGQSRPDDKYLQGPALRQQYIAMIAATAVYTPLRSKTTDEDYMQAMLSLVGANQSDARELYTQISVYKKPLRFFVDKPTINAQSKLGNSYQTVGGTSRLLTLGTVLNRLEKEGDLIACTVEGKMIADGDTWLYRQNKLSTINDAEVSIVSSDIEDNDVFNGTSDKYTRPVFELNFDYQDPDPGTITALLLKNIYEDEYLRSYWTQRSGEPLYLDAIGNIVLMDNTVILPAAANPTYFAVPFESGSESWWYNPYTVAFWNSYPVIYGSNASPSIQTKKDRIKSVAFYQDKTAVDDFFSFADISKVRNPFHLESAYGSDMVESVQYKFAVGALKSIKNKWVEQWKTTGHLYPYFVRQVSGTPGSNDSYITENMAEVMVGEISTGDAEDAFKSKLNRYPVRLLPLIEGDTQIFPYNIDNERTEFSSSSELSRFVAAKRIAMNFYMYMTDSASISDINGDAPVGNGIFREGWFFATIFCSVMDGMATPVAYEKSVARRNIAVSDSLNIFSSGFLKLSGHLSNFGKNITGFIGVPSPDEKSALVPVYDFMSEYKYFIFFVGCILLMFTFLRSRSYTKTLIVTGVLLGVFAGCLYVLPLLTPFLVGSPTAMIASKLTGSTLLVKGEQYADVFSDDPLNQFELGSVKLYNMSLDQVTQLRKDRGLPTSSFMFGRHDLDSDMGVYLQGTEIRLDLKVHWKNNLYLNKFVQNSETLDDGVTEMTSVNAYQITNQDVMTSSDLITYYTPMLVLEEGLVKNLNLFLQNYRIPRSLIRYPDGLNKDAYIVNSYTHSYPFLYVLPQVQEKLKDEDKLEEMAIISKYFSDPGDIMRIQWIADTGWEDVPHEYVNTIWIQTMYKNGYYDVNYGQARRQNLVNKVNDEVYSFLIQVSPDVGLVSDENIIKLTSLYATFAFNEQISRWGAMVYPRYLAMDELSVTDIITATVLKSSTRFMFYDVDLMSNVYAEKGVFGVLAVDIIIIIMIAIALINKILVPLVYFGSLIAVLVLTLLNKSIAPALSFATKVMGLLLGLQYISIILVSVYHLFAYSTNLFLLALFLAGILWVTIKILKWIFKSIIKGRVPVPTGMAGRINRKFGGMSFRRNSYRGGNQGGYYDSYSSMQGQEEYYQGYGDDDGELNQYEEDERTGREYHPY